MLVHIVEEGCSLSRASRSRHIVAAFPNFLTSLQPSDTSLQPIEIQITEGASTLHSIGSSNYFLCSKPNRTFLCSVTTVSHRSKTLVSIYKYTFSREAKKMAPRSKAKRRFAPLRAADRKAEIYSHFPALFELAKKMKFALNFQPCFQRTTFRRTGGRPAGRPDGRMAGRPAGRVQ